MHDVKNSNTIINEIFFKLNESQETRFFIFKMLVLHVWFYTKSWRILYYVFGSWEQTRAPGINPHKQHALQIERTRNINEIMKIRRETLPGLGMLCCFDLIF